MYEISYKQQVLSFNYEFLKSCIGNQTGDHDIFVLQILSCVNYNSTLLDETEFQIQNLF